MKLYIMESLQRRNFPLNGFYPPPPPHQNLSSFLHNKKSTYRAAERESAVPPPRKRVLGHEALNTNQRYPVNSNETKKHYFSRTGAFRGRNMAPHCLIKMLPGGESCHMRFLVKTAVLSNVAF
ncbi:MAG: hypothetical protein LBK08_03415 [Treponema sp.]|jgi:hypothetical protein|nr:hypothetical protein [Treponema sp.]